MIRLVRVPFVNVSKWMLAQANASMALGGLGRYYAIKSMFLFGMPLSAMDSVCVRVQGVELLYVASTPGCDESPGMSGGELMELMGELEGLRKGQIPLQKIDAGEWHGGLWLEVSVKLMDIPEGAKGMDLVMMVERRN